MFSPGGAVCGSLHIVAFSTVLLRACKCGKKNEREKGHTRYVECVSASDFVFHFLLLLQQSTQGARFFGCDKRPIGLKEYSGAMQLPASWSHMEGERICVNASRPGRRLFVMRRPSSRTALNARQDVRLRHVSPQEIRT